MTPRPISALYWLSLLLILPTSANADERIPASPKLRWWKGNIHTHTFWSDGNDFPEMVAEWYRTRDYNFLALSDHNILSDGQRWMSEKEIVMRGGATVLPKYRARFGPQWIESRTEAGSGLLDEYRLKPLNEFRALVEERGRFILLVGEEISDAFDGKPIHMNATNLKSLLPPLGGTSVQEVMRANLRAAEDHATRTGREIIVHLNHPNFGYAITAKDLAAVVEERFFEVYNGHPAVNHLGDKDRPSVEVMWDLANTIRLTQLKAHPLLGVATDDSHNYHGRENASPGRGWIMVQAYHLTPESLLRAMKQGRFYASSGVALKQVTYAAESKTLTIDIDAEPGVTYTTEFLGTRHRPNAELPPTDKIGEVFARSKSITAEYTLKGDELYVRAVVTADVPHPNPSFDGQAIQAWTQPVGWSAGSDP